MSSKTIYRTAAALAAIQLDRPFSARDIARIEACVAQAILTYTPNSEEAWVILKDKINISAKLSDEALPRLTPIAGVEEALDDAGKRIAAMFAPAMPRVEDPPLT